MKPLDNAFHSVCAIEETRLAIAGLSSHALLFEPKTEFHGNGVFVAPDAVLTALHVVKNISAVSFVNDDGDVAFAAPKEPDWDERHDLAVVFLDRAIGKYVSPVKNVEVPLSKLVGGWLMTRFRHQRTQHEVQYGLKHFVKQIEGYTTFFSNAPVQGGFSGSPVFDGEGHVISCVSKVNSGLDDLRREKGAQQSGIIETGFFAPDPQVVATLVERALTL